LREPQVQIESGVSYLADDDQLKSKECLEKVKRKCGDNSYKILDRKRIIRLGTAATTAGIVGFLYYWIRPDYSLPYIMCNIITVFLAVVLENLRHFKVIRCTFRAVLVIVVFQSLTLLILTSKDLESHQRRRSVQSVISVNEVLEDIKNRHEAANATTVAELYDNSLIKVQTMRANKFTDYGLEPRVLWNDPSQLQWYPGRRIDIMRPEPVMPDVPLSTISVILIAFNESDYVERTIKSIKEFTHENILHEIILIDDHSEPELSKSYNQEEFEGLVKYIYNDDRIGLIKSRSLGANMATGDIIVFFDCHVKPRLNWESPIIQRINHNYKHVVVPAIPILDGYTWEQKGSAVGYKMMMDWDLGFHWFEDGTDDVPIMSGGLLSISNKWWHESGEYDTGMEQWGAENIEQSLRVWLCGGEISVARESHVLHLFRSKFPYKIDARKPKKNKDRLLATWFDQYLPYSTKDSMKKLRKDHDVSERLKLRNNLDCKNMDFWVERFRDVLTSRGMIGARLFQLKAIYHGDEVPRIEVPPEPIPPAKESNITTTITDNGYCLIPHDMLSSYFALVEVDQEKMKDLPDDRFGNGQYKALLKHYTPEFGRKLMKDSRNRNIQNGLTAVPCSSTNDALLWRQAGEEQDNLVYVGVNSNPVGMTETLKGEYRCLHISENENMNATVSQCVYNKYNPFRALRKYNSQTIQYLKNSTPDLYNDHSLSETLKSNIISIKDLGSFQIVGNYKEHPTCLYPGIKDDHDKLLFDEENLDGRLFEDNDMDFDLTNNPKTFTVVNKLCHEVSPSVSWAEVNIMWRPIDVVGPRAEDVTKFDKSKNLRGGN